MKLTQNWVGYLDRSYEQIKASCLSRLGINNPEISDHTESNILIIILSMFAGIAEQLNLYIDSMAKEAFIGSAREYTSLVKLSKLLDYQVKARTASSVNLTFELYNTTTDLPVPFIPTTTLGQLLISKGTATLSDNGLEFFTIEDGVILPNQSQAIITASQYTQFLNQIIGVTNGIAGQAILLPENYVHKSISLEIASVLWTEADSLGLLTATDQKFVVETLEDGNAYVIFGDGISGAIPPNATTIYANYKTTFGDLGNVPPLAIDTITSVITTPPGTALRVFNRDYASGGAGFETTEQIRRNAPKSIRTLERAVTYLDYSDLGSLAPGVKEATIDYCCGKTVDLYVAPSSRGIATTALTNSTREYFESKRMVTTRTRVMPAGITRIYVKGNLFSQALFTSNEVYEAAVEALNNEYGYDNSSINRDIKLSSIITLLENLPEVDTFEPVQMYIEPYARPSGNAVPLNITYGQIKYSSMKKYRLVYQSLSNSFSVFKDGIYMGYAAIGEPFMDSSSQHEVSFTIQDGSYINGNQWVFVVHPSFPESFPDYSIQVSDNSVPIFDVIDPTDGVTPSQIFGELDVIINTTSNFTKPNC
jgi:hypothetical protein